MMVKSKPRSVFGTRTGKSAVLTFWVTLALAIAPFAIDSWGRKNNWSQKDIDNATGAIAACGAALGVSGSLGAIVGRASATDKVSSPGWMPGHDEAELEQQSDRELQ